MSNRKRHYKGTYTLEGRGEMHTTRPGEGRVYWLDHYNFIYEMQWWQVLYTDDKRIEAYTWAWDAKTAQAVRTVRSLTGRRVCSFDHRPAPTTRPAGTPEPPPIAKPRAQK
jgi:hypothetical protein